MFLLINHRVTKTTLPPYINLNSRKIRVNKKNYYRDRISAKKEGKKFILHPLIHTLLPETQVQDVEKKKSGVKDSAIF
jgi:hypothetical protein